MLPDRNKAEQRSRALPVPSLSQRWARRGEGEAGKGQDRFRVTPLLSHLVPALSQDRMVPRPCRASPGWDSSSSCSPSPAPSAVTAVPGLWRRPRAPELQPQDFTALPLHSNFVFFRCLLLGALRCWAGRFAPRWCFLGGPVCRGWGGCPKDEQ